MQSPVTEKKKKVKVPKLETTAGEAAAHVSPKVKKAKKAITEDQVEKPKEKKKKICWQVRT